MKTKWAVLAVYQDAAAREAAVKFCDGLVQRFWPETSFDLDWHDWQTLGDNEPAQQARQKVQDANIIIIASSSGGTIEPFVRRWLELALSQRSDREGILVGLSAETDGPLRAEAAATQQYLRKLAHQSGLDYLTSVPPSLCYSVPETIEACNLRATQVTSVLDKILHRATVPPSML
ncbi:MAG TPA: hypothetical protein VFE51_14745 [Verrucomicrobiae bacterium]|nr:hypothetical protein [Verrucomicrobiae bacterium]